MRKDGTVSYLGAMFEVPNALAGKTVQLVVDPHAGVVVGVEDEAGETLGPASRLDAHANLHRVRRRPDAAPEAARTCSGPNLVEMAHAQYHGAKGD